MQRLVRELPIFLMAFESSSGRWPSRKSEMGGCVGRRRVLAQVSLQGHGSFHGILGGFLPHPPWNGFCTFWNRVQPLGWFCIFKRCLAPSASQPICRSGPSPPEPPQRSKKTSVTGGWPVKVGQVGEGDLRPGITAVELTSRYRTWASSPTG